MSPFTYTTLSYEGDRKLIRLIELLPGEDNEQIKCNLKSFELGRTPDYIALSYCWGDPRNRVVISCNNQALGILTNLHSALIHMRESDKAGWFWADALCIDQANAGEKNKQILLMRDIYRNARTTNIWLGEESGDSDRAMLLVGTLVRVSGEQAARNDKRAIFEMGPQGLNLYNIPPLFHRDYRALLLLLGRPWFRRIWIIQEVAVSLSAVVICGRCRATWADFVEAVDYGTSRLKALPAWEDPAVFRYVAQIDSARQKSVKVEEQNLLELLIDYRHFEATNKRDKVYALCGLSNDSGPDRLGINPDYSLDIREVYQELALSVLAKTRNLDLLSVPRATDPTSSLELPSWVPNWSMPSGAQCFRQQPHSFQATPAELLSQIQFQDDNTTLGIDGHIFDVIEEVSVVNPRMNDDKTSLMQRVSLAAAEQYVYNEWEKTARARSQTKYVTGEEIIDAYWQTLIAGRIQEGFEVWKGRYLSWEAQHRWLFRHLPLKYLRAAFPFISVTFWVSMVISSCISLAWQGPKVLNSDGVIEFNWKMTAAMERRLFRSHKGYIGLAPHTARNGDSIGLFRGGMVPLVIRPEGSSNSAPRWKLVGDCYVHGIMGGQGFEEEKCETMWFF